MPCHHIVDSDGKVVGHICTPSVDSVELVDRRCFDKRCNKRMRRHIVAFYGWYGPTWTCMTCGRVSRTDGEGIVHEALPPGHSAQRARDKNIERAWAVLNAWKRDNRKGDNGDT
jgi:hypothetical protein